CSPDLRLRQRHIPLRPPPPLDRRRVSRRRQTPPSRAPDFPRPNASPPGRQARKAGPSRRSTHLLLGPAPRRYGPSILAAALTRATSHHRALLRFLGNH